MTGIILLVVLVIVLGVAYGWYASIIGRRNQALSALAGIDVQLNQRSELIPNILKIARRFLEHERDLQREITQLRQQMTQAYDPKDPAQVADHLKAAGQLSDRMGQLMVQVENYPELKSDATMVQAQQTYNEVEAQIAAARRFYNSAVAQLNNSVQIFPGSVLAGMAGVKEMPFYEAEAAARAPVNADQYLS